MAPARFARFHQTPSTSGKNKPELAKQKAQATAPKMPVSLILMVVVSLATEEPDAETQKMVDEIRVPKGKAVLDA